MNATSLDRVVFTTPFPPSTNNLFVNVRRRGRVPSKEYMAWRKEADAMLLGQRVGAMRGPVDVEIVLRDGRRLDIDNGSKGILDFAVRHGIIEDDNPKILRSLRITQGDAIGARVTITRAQVPA